MSYYESRIKELESKIEEMAQRERLKAIPVEAKLMDRVGELKAENARLKAEVERMTQLQAETLVERNKAEAQVERLTQRLGGVRLIVTEEMYDELNTKYLEQQHELHNIALTARQILDEKIDLKAEVERLTAFTTRTIIPNEELKAENARLKAEVEQSKRINTELLVLSERQASDIRRLSAELSNITGWGRGLESDLCRARAELMLEKAEVERIRLIAHDNKQALYNANAQVERLTKAGDTIIHILCKYVPRTGAKYALMDWNAAKEGKQP